MSRARMSLVQFLDRVCPALTALAAVALLVPLHAHATEPRGSFTGKVVLQKNGKPLELHSGVVVYLESVPDTRPASAAAAKKIEQRDLAFLPELTVVVKGETVEFPNRDKVFHNVFSLSRAARFDLGLYKSGTSKAVTFTREGVVDIYCNIHPQMVAKVKVVPNRFYAVTDAQGRFRIEGIPPGKWPYVLWQPWGEPVRGEISIQPAQAAEAELRVERGERNNSHLRKDGTPYGHYQ
jgi:plastocyanin